MTTKKIAVISIANINDLKGVFYSVLNKVRELQKFQDYELDAYLILTYENWLIRTLRGTKKHNKIKTYTFEGVTFQNIWYNFSLIDYLIARFFHNKRIFYSLFINKTIDKFKDYDLLSAHSFDSALIANKLYLKYKIPYTVTWHGSDIHTIPFLSRINKNQIKDLIINANMNYFVSKNLLECSEKIIKSENKMVLYNGVNENFHRISKEDIHNFLNSKGIFLKKVIAFIGGLDDIKNVLLLPYIFNIISKNRHDCIFWIIGDGKLRKKLEYIFKNLNLKVDFWGDISYDKIPLLMNCINVMVLPSKNEGLPLVTLEAQACGITVVGSRVGGIPEAIGIENTCPLDENFIQNLSNLIVEKLDFPNKPQLQKEFSWKYCASIEHKMFNEYL